MAQLAENKGFLSDTDGSEGEGFYLREDGSVVDQKLVLEVDDIIKNILEDCEKYVSNNEIEHADIEENIGKVLRNRFYKHLKITNDPEDVRHKKEELFDWNVRFLLIDNACTRLDELSVKSWGKFEVSSFCYSLNFAMISN